MATEVHPVGTFPKSEASPDPIVSGKSLEELENLVKWPSRMAEALEAHEQTESTPEPPPEPVEVPVEVPSEPEPAQEAAKAAEPEKPAESTQEDIDKELLRAQMEALEAHSKKLEAKLTGREAGQQGYIKQLQDRLRRLESGEAPEQTPEPSYRPESATEMAPATRDGFRTWAVQKASQEAVQSFMDSHADIKEMEQDAMKYLQETGFDARNVLQLDDPIAAGREMTRVLEETYWHLKETRGRTRMAELLTKKADQVRGLDEAKRRAAPSASGSPSVPSAPRKGTKDLSLSELEAKMKEMRASSGR